MDRSIVDEWLKYGDCEYLNPFGVQLRYPFGFELTEDDATISIRKCERVVGFIKTKING